MAQDEIDDSSEIEEHLYKVLVVGDFGVGEVVCVCVCVCVIMERPCLHIIYLFFLQTYFFLYNYTCGSRSLVWFNCFCVPLIALHHRRHPYHRHMARLLSITTVKGKVSIPNAWHCNNSVFT